MTDWNRRTRRAALAMMGGGATLWAAKTAGFTNVSVLRDFAVDVAPDDQASLRVLSTDPNLNPGVKKFLNPRDISFINDRDRNVEVTVTSGGFDVTFLDKDGNEIGNEVELGTTSPDEDGEDPDPELPPDGDRDRAFLRASIDDTESEIEDGIDVTASGVDSPFTLTFRREFTVFNPEDDELDELNQWFDASVADTVRAPNGSVAVNNQRVDRWIRRQPESLEDIDLRQTTTGTRPTYIVAGIGSPARPAIEFTGTRRMSSEDATEGRAWTDLRRGTPKQANVFFVFRPRQNGTGDREVMRLHQNDNNFIRYRRGGQVTVNLQGTQKSVDLQTATDTTHLVSILLKRDNENVILEAKRNGSTQGTVTFENKDIPAEPIARVGSSNNSSTFDVLFGEMRIYHVHKEGTITTIENSMKTHWNIN